MGPALAACTQVARSSTQVSALPPVKGCLTWCSSVFSSACLPKSSLVADALPCVGVSVPMLKWRSAGTCWML